MESGASGTSPGPSSTTGQTGESQRLVTWTDDAWNDIQTAHTDWGWMRTTASFTTVAGTANYPLGTGAGTCGIPVANFGAWTRGTARNYLTSAGQISEVTMDDRVTYDEWRDLYQLGALRLTQTRPYVLTFGPDKSICLGPPALAGYTIEQDYFTAPVALVNDTDIPSLPTQFHTAIVWRALMHYGAYEGASEAYDRGELEFGKMMGRLDDNRLPEVTFGPALA